VAWCDLDYYYYYKRKQSTMRDLEKNSLLPALTCEITLVGFEDDIGRSLDNLGVLY
jgi:hypothetical protein